MGGVVNSITGGGGIGGAVSGLLGLQTPQAPTTADYKGAAEATAAGNLEAAKYATVANRANQWTPYGTLTWKRGATDYDPWTQTVQLNETGQKLLDLNNQAQLGMGGLLQGATQRTQDAFNKPFDFNSVQDVQNKAYDAYKSRLDPQWAQYGQSMDAKLANQGIGVGTEAYNNAMRSFNQGRNDAYQQANLAAIQTAPQTMQMATAIRNQPLNELNALQTGAQVQNPQFSNYAQQATTAGADYSGALNQGWNSQLGAANANNANIMGMLQAGASAYGAKK